MTHRWLRAIAFSFVTLLPATLLANAQPRDIHVQQGTSMSVSASPDGKWLAIDLQGSLWIVPSGGGQARRITELFDDARQPVWSPDGRSLAYFAFRDGGYDLWTVAPDGSASRKISSGRFDDREPAFSPDGRQLAFASDRSGRSPGHGSYDIWTLQLASGQLRQITYSADEERMPSWSADGSELAYSSTRDGISALWATHLASGRERELRRAAHGQLDAPSWSQQGRLAYVVSGDGGSRLEIDGQRVSGDENVFAFRVSWQADGSYHYVSDGLIRQRRGNDSNVRTIAFDAVLPVQSPSYVHVRRDFDSATPRRALGIVRPAISPDGRQVAFVALGDLYLLDIGGSPRKLTDDPHMELDPAWSPDGRQLVYSSDKGGGLPQLWVRDLDSGQDRQLTTIDTQPLEAAWSPDGSKIAFLDVDGMWGVAGLCVVEVASGKITRLQPTLPQPGRPTWSGDSQRVALALPAPLSASFREGLNQILVVSADGSGQTHWQTPLPELSIDTRGGGGPAWSPDGRQMAAIYEGELRVWPVSATGEPLAAPRAVTREIAHSPSWAGDSRTLLFQSNDRLKTVDIDSGRITEVPLDLHYTLQQPQGRTLVHVGHAFDGHRQTLLDDVDIVIDGHRIHSIGAHDDANHRADVRLIDAPQLTAIPGLIEFHAHPSRDFGAAMHRAWLAWGITTVRNPGDQPYHGVEDREASEAGVRIGPRMYATGHLLEWQRVYYKMGIALSGSAHLQKELARGKALRYDLLKSYVRLPDLQQRQLVEYAHQVMGVPVATHEIYPAAFSGVDNTEHMGATSRRGYSPKQAAQGRVYQDVVALFGQTQRPLTPTHFGSLAAYMQQHPQLRSDPRLDLYPAWARDRSRDAQVPLRVKDALEGTIRGIKAVHDAGGQLVAGSDTPIAINLHSELGAYVDAGLSPYQALRSATVVPAQLLGLQAGELKAGKLADIVLIEGDPLQDISAATQVRTVIANGRVFTVDELLRSP
jgi:Tol biopolymer transport system component